MFASLMMAVFQTIGVFSILPFMNVVMHPESIYEDWWIALVYDKLNFTSFNSFVFFLGFVMLAIIMIGNLVSFLAFWLQLRFTWRKNHNLATALLKKYLSLPYVYFLNQHSAELSKNILVEAGQLTSGFMIPLLNVFTRGMVVLFMITMLFIVDPFVSLMALFALSGAYTLIFLSLRRRLTSGGKETIEANKGRFQAADEALGGIKDIKLMGREPFFVDRFISHSQKFVDLQAWLQVVGRVPKYLMEFVAFGGVISLVLFLILVEANIAQAIPLIGVFAFAGYRLIPALQEVYTNMSLVQFHRAVLDKLYKDMTEGSSSYFNPEYKELPEALPFQSTVRLEQISFWYPNTGEAVLRAISIGIPRHTSVAVVGPTGSGKTTLIDILLGLLTPQQGKIVVDGIVVTDDNMRSWQRNLGYVPQQIYLSDDTIARNIAFGIPDYKIDWVALEKAARIANLHDFISCELPIGYQTIVGERGIRLSGGQKQRIGIARALYHDPEVLVLDEATSSLDGITEDAVLEAIENAAKVKTLVLIAHRLATVMNCDQVYLIDKGEVVAKGTYDELMNSNSQFRAMAKAGEK